MVFDWLEVVVVEVTLGWVQLEWQGVALLRRELDLDIAVASREWWNSYFHQCCLDEMVIPVLWLTL